MSEINDGVECVTFPGKGQGLVAKRAFEVGDVVLRETPIVDMPQSIFDLEEPDRVERWLDRKINAMTSSQRQQFFDLSDRNSEGSESLDKTTLGIFYTNCMNFVDESAAVFPKMARGNHSCAPNTEFITNHSLHAQELIAVKPIEKGAEITLSYLPANGEGSDVALKRKDYLKENYGFDCICSACTNSTNEEIRSKVRELQLRLSSSCDSIKSGTGLSLYEMEELADGLDMIGSKVHHREEMFRRLFDRAIAGNDKVLAYKCFSSVYLYKAILSSPDLEEWKVNFLRTKNVNINGTTYFFPPDDTTSN